MTSQLEKILQQKYNEVARLKSAKKSFKQALRGHRLAIIAEIKRKSPSKGHLAPIADPVTLAQSYIDGGADAISVLTDETFFNGHLSDLTRVSHHLQNSRHPVLRKDFIVDNIQIAEAYHHGADAILIIVAAVGANTANLLKYAKSLGLEALVEVHNHHELELALTSGAEIIGVNNRDLHTLKVDTEQAFKLMDSIPKDIIKVAESGILQPQLAREYYRAGFDAVLIGEALVQSAQPQQFMELCRGE